MNELFRIAQLVRRGERRGEQLARLRERHLEAIRYAMSPGANLALAAESLVRIRLRRAALLLEAEADRREAESLLARTVEPIEEAGPCPAGAN